jgi:hypothetical protein
MSEQRPANAKPAKPRKPVAQLERLGDTLRLVYRKRDQTGCFLILWLTGWTVGCVALAYVAMFGNQPGILLFGVPFWASWIFVFCLVIYMFCKRETLELDRDGLRFIRTALVRLKYRDVPLAELKGFESRWFTTDSETGAQSRGIEIVTLGQPIDFARQIEGNEQVWLLSELNEHLAQLQGRNFEQKPEVRTEELIAQPKQEDIDRPTLLVLRPSAQPVVAPSDCRWQREDDFNSLVFVQRGRISFSGIGGLLFINLFWNGIVSVFLGELFGWMPGNNGAPKGWEWWGLFVFLIPFEAIGLAMFIALLAAVFAPFSRTEWNFGMQEIVCRIRWFGVGPTWTYPVMIIDRLELRRNESLLQKKFGMKSNHTDTGGTETGRFALAIVDRENTEVCTISSLTEGEARWMADVVQRERPAWFR